MLFLVRQQAKGQSVLKQVFLRKSRFSTGPVRLAIDPTAAPIPRKRHPIRNFFLTSTLLLGGGFAACVYFALQNDDFYCTFTTYVPFAGLVVDTVDDFMFRQSMRGRASSTSKADLRKQPEVVRFDGTLKANPSPSAPPSQTKSVEEQISSAVNSAKETAKEKVNDLLSSETGRDVKQALQGSTDSRRPRPKARSDNTTTSAVGTAAAPRVLSRDGLLPNNQQDLETIDVNEIESHLIDAANIINSYLKANNINFQDDPFFSTLVTSVQRASEALREERKSLEAKHHENVDTLTREAAEKAEKDYVAAKLNLVESYNQRLQLALDTVSKKSVTAANNKLAAQYNELLKQFNQEVNDRVEKERNGRLSQLSELKKDLSNLQEAMVSSGKILESEDGIVRFFVELANLQRVLSSEKTIPLKPYIDSITKALPSDPLVKAVANSVNPSVKKYGVLSHSQLAARFNLIEPEIRRASLVTPDAGIAGHIGSIAASQLLARKEGLPAGEDVESVIARTHTYLQQGDVIRAVTEVNSLQGWPKKIARDWLEEGRKRSEVEFLVKVLSDEGRLWSISK